LHELFAVSTLASGRLGQGAIHTATELLDLDGTKLIPLFHEPERFTDNFAG
jgi:hypothetical protein